MKTTDFEISEVTVTVEYNDMEFYVTINNWDSIIVNEDGRDLEYGELYTKLRNMASDKWEEIERFLKRGGMM